MTLSPAARSALVAGGAATQVLGTAALFALFLSLTAHVAARNVLGDVPVRAALLVGPVPAVVAVVGTALRVPPAVAVAVAVALDALAVRYAYGLGRRLTAYVTFIHAVVSVILGTVLFSLLYVISSAPA
jgi:hypothetical protein